MKLMMTESNGKCLLHPHPNNNYPDMRFLIIILLIAFLSFIACMYLPWWSITVVAFIVISVIPVSPGKSFMAGFISVFLLWAVMTFWISLNNDHLLAGKVSTVILKISNAYLLIFITALIGGIVGGLAALSAGLLRTIKY